VASYPSIQKYNIFQATVKNTAIFKMDAGAQTTYKDRQHLFVASNSSLTANEKSGKFPPERRTTHILILLNYRQ